jgi:peptide/nickel transport system substrate-binding protein
MHLRTVAALMLAPMLAAGPALAQKSKDTLRFAVNNPFPLLSSYHLPTDEAAVLYRDMYEPLIAFDEYNQKIVPQLAKSWTAEPGVYEFDLKEGITFHNGNKFDADDVVATLKYVSDPATKLTFKSRYDWMKSIEKLGPYKVRITAKEPNSADMSLLAYRIRIWDAETMAKLDNVEDYGRLTPVGTGVYKAVQIDKNTGSIIERYDNYKTDPEKKAAIKRVVGVPMPDQQTQIAQFMTGGLDLLRNVTPDTAKALAANPNTVITNVASPSIFYLSLDAMGVAGNKALTDKRVRRAIFMAIDRSSMIKYLVPGGEVATKMDALCLPTIIDCKYNEKAPAYDPEGAKKLLAEAGYPNGFEFEYNVYAPFMNLGQAIAGDLRKIGVTAKLQSVDLALYRRKQGAGELQGLSVLTPLASHPDVSNVLSIFFAEPALQYYGDKVIADNMVAASKEFDRDKRMDDYARIFDRTNSESYIFPVTTVPTVLAHTKDVGTVPDKYAAGDLWAASFIWK